MYLTNYHFYYPKNYLYSKPVKGLQSFELDYRFAFNGKERDNETYGEGNAYDFGARIYDSRIGRWLAVDPFTRKQPYASPYKSMSNNPILFIDPDGRTEYETITLKDEKTGKFVSIRKAVSNDIMTDGKYETIWDNDKGEYVNVAKYYDFEIITTRAIGLDGKITVTKSTKIYTHLEPRDIDFYGDLTNRPKKGKTKFDWGNLEGPGGLQKGGFRITYDLDDQNALLEGGSQTKYFAEEDVKTLKLNNLMNMIKLGSLQQISNIFDRAKLIEAAADYGKSGIETAASLLKNVTTEIKPIPEFQVCLGCGAQKVKGNLVRNKNDTAGMKINRKDTIKKEISDFHSPN
jgi:RHS repeat-associated protein